jgi:hypothetical protein
MLNQCTDRICFVFTTLNIIDLLNMHELYLHNCFFEFGFNESGDFSSTKHKLYVGKHIVKYKWFVRNAYNKSLYTAKYNDFFHGSDRTCFRSLLKVRYRYTLSWSKGESETIFQMAWVDEKLLSRLWYTLVLALACRRLDIILLSRSGETQM